MCDDLTAIEEEQALESRGIDRRSFAALGAAGLGTLAAPLAAAVPGGLTERLVSLATPDGKMDAFFVHPAKGKHPAVILWPDIAGLRDAYKVMARRLAADGYAVLVLNQYYRSAPAPHFKAIAEWRTPEGQAVSQARQPRQRSRPPSRRPTRSTIVRSSSSSAPTRTEKPMPLGVSTLQSTTCLP